MSRWSDSDVSNRRLRRSAAERGQADPIVALLAVFAVTVGVSLYLGVFADVRPDDHRDLASPTLDRVADATATAGVTDPTRLEEASDVAPAGHRLNATLDTDDGRWTAGPTAPPDADAADRLVSARVREGRVRPARLTVAVWR